MSKKEALTYRDHEGVLRKVKGCSLSVDGFDRHWIWCEPLKHNLVYKTKGRENALLAAINSLLFTIELQDKRITGLQRIADLAERFADEIRTDEEYE